jgi:hypothetical protein
MAEKCNKKFSSFSVCILLLISFTSLANHSHLNAAEISYYDELEYETWIDYPDGWFFTEIEKEYLVEYEEGKRLVNSIKFDDGKYVTSCNSDQIVIPEKFITSTIQIIGEMLAKGWATYLFRLDTFHGHIFVTDDHFEENYMDLNTEEMIRRFAQDQTLGFLFHNAEHLALRNPPGTGPIDPIAQEMIKNRNVIGWFTGRPLEVVRLNEEKLLGNRKSFTATIPAGYRSIGIITFKANRNGAFTINHKNKTIHLDISPYECFYH